MTMARLYQLIGLREDAMSLLPIARVGRSAFAIARRLWIRPSSIRRISGGTVEARADNAVAECLTVGLLTSCCLRGAVAHLPPLRVFSPVIAIISSCPPNLGVKLLCCNDTTRYTCEEYPPDAARIES